MCLYLEFLIAHHIFILPKRGSVKFTSIYMCVCMFVCMCLCILRKYVCVCVCMYVHVYVLLYVCMDE
jgi:hypothetical protein